MFIIFYTIEDELQAKTQEIAILKKEKELLETAILELAALVANKKEV